MSDEAVCAAAIGLTVLFAVWFCRFTKNFRTRKQKFIEKAKTAGNYTQGEYLKSKWRPGIRESHNISDRNPIQKVWYRYRVDGKEYTKHMTFQSIGTVSIEYPMSVTVYYDPRNPRRAYCPEEASEADRRTVRGLLCTAVIVLFLFGSFHLLRFLIGLIFK